jgi:hypothetical protein
VFLFFAYLINNLIQNLAARDQNISFDFLGDPAGYDINQMLIPYDNQMSHLRAAFVGVLNTLLVAFLGCITATVLGVRGRPAAVEQLARGQADGGLCRDVPQRAGADLDPDHLQHHGLRPARAKRVPGGRPGSFDVVRRHRRSPIAVSTSRNRSGNPGR